MINLRNYGDLESVRQDVKTLHKILNRQGMNLVVDCIAEHIGQTAITFDIEPTETRAALDSVLAELEAQTLERI